MTHVWYHLVKVPLIVSPHPPSFLLQPRVYPRALPTFLGLCFGASLVIQFACPLFSWSYELLFPQPLYFDNHLRCPRGGGVRTFFPTVRSLCLCVETPPNSFACHTSRKCARNSFPCHTYKKAGGGLIMVNHDRPNQTTTAAELPPFLFTLDFARRTKYCSTANYCSLERGL